MNQESVCLLSCPGAPAHCSLLGVGLVAASCQHLAQRGYPTMWTEGSWLTPQNPPMLKEACCQPLECCGLSLQYQPPRAQGYIPSPGSPQPLTAPCRGIRSWAACPSRATLKGPAVALQVSVGWAELSVALPAPICFLPLLFPGVIQGHTLVSALHAQPLRLPTSPGSQPVAAGSLPNLSGYHTCSRSGTIMKGSAVQLPPAVAGQPSISLCLGLS